MLYSIRMIRKVVFEDEKSSGQEMSCVELGSLSNATVSFLITRGSFSSKFAAVYKISSKSDDFFAEIWRYNDYQNGGRPPSWNWFTTIPDHPQCLLLAAAAFQIHVNLIHRSEDIAI